MFLYFCLQSIQLMDKIFQIDWPIVNNNVKKGLLIMMKRSTIPIEISTVHIITLNLDSFVGVSIEKFILMYDPIETNKTPLFISHLITFK